MAEVITAIEIASTIGDVVKSLYTYISAVKDAKDDIRRLTQELFALKGALEYFDLHDRSDPEGPPPAQLREMLQMTSDTLAGIQRKLAPPKSGFGMAVKTLVWPFKSAEVKRHLDSVERAKTWFIMVILKDSSDTTGRICGEMRSLADAVHADIVDRQTDTMVRKADELLAWLAPSDAAGLLAKATENRVIGTGRWALDNGFLEWQQPVEVKKPFMWITGKSGSGKTVLFSTIVEELQTICAEPSSNRLVGYHCCSLDDASSQRVPNIFGSVLAQICSVRPDLLKHITPFRHTGNSLVPQNNLTISQIGDILRYALESLECLYILVDALNETPYEQTLVSALVQLCNANPKIRVLVTCVREPMIMDDTMQLRIMRPRMVDHDIELYVRHRLKSEVSFQALSSNIQDLVRRKIIADANGMFRWAKLCMDRLSTLRTGRDIRDALSDMPTTLNDTYVGILDRIVGDSDRALAREALTWLCFSLRPLRLQELAEAVVLREADTSIDDDCRLTNPLVILDICRGLAVLSRAHVTLAHDSVRSFLTSSHIRDTSAAFFAVDAEEAHRRIMRKCLTYLCLDVFRSGPADSREGYHERRRSHPLIYYATACWPIHSEEYTMPAADEALILAFFGTKDCPGGGSFESWVQFLLETWNVKHIRKTEPLYYAASFSMLPILKLLVRPEQGVDLNRPGGRFGSPPLFIAIWRRNTEAALLLLKAGADPMARDSGVASGQTCYAAAKVKRLDDVVRLMRELGAGEVPQLLESKPGVPLRPAGGAVEG